MSVITLNSATIDAIAEAAATKVLDRLVRKPDGSYGKVHELIAHTNVDAKLGRAAAEAAHSGADDARDAAETILSRLPGGSSDPMGEPAPPRGPVEDGTHGGA